MYKEGFVKEQLKINYCGVYYTGDDTTLCIQRSYSVMRLFFWLIGMLGTSINITKTLYCDKMLKRGAVMSMTACVN